MKKNLKLWLSALAVVAIFLGAISYFQVFTPKVRTIKFYAAHGPVEIITKPLHDFKAEVESKSHGRLKVEIVVTADSIDHNLQVERKAVDLIQKNEMQMGQIYAKTMAHYDQDFMALEVPLLFENHKHSFATVDGEIGNELLAKLEAKSPFKGLAFTYSGGYRFITTKSKPIKRAEDFQGLRLATGTLASTAILEKLGVIPSNGIEKVTIRNQVEKGQLDGLVTVYPRYFYNNEYKISTYANELNLNMQYTVLLINKEFFNSLTKEDQELVEQSARRISLVERKTAIEIADEVKKNGAQYGITFVRMNKGELAKVQEKLAAVDWEKEFHLTPGLLDRIKALAGAKVTQR